MEDQAIGGEQQDLEEDEEVEQVAGQEGAVEPEQLQLEEDVKMPAHPVQALARLPQGEAGQQGRDQQQPGRQPIRHQDDTEGGRPVSQAVDQDPSAGGGGQESQGQDDLDRHRQQAEGTAVGQGPPAQEEQEDARHEGDENRGNDER